MNKKIKASLILMAMFSFAFGGNKANVVDSHEEQVTHIYKETNVKRVNTQNVTHNFSVKSWEWSSDNLEATINLTCNDCVHEESHKVKTNKRVKIDSTCIAKGYTEYIAQFEIGEQLFITTKEVQDVPLKDHQYKDGKCVVCGKKDPSVNNKPSTPNDNETIQDLNNELTIYITVGTVGIVLGLASVGYLVYLKFFKK